MSSWGSLASATISNNRNTTEYSLRVPSGLRCVCPRLGSLGWPENVNHIPGESYMGWWVVDTSLKEIKDETILKTRIMWETQEWTYHLGMVYRNLLWWFWGWLRMVYYCGLPHYSDRQLATTETSYHELLNWIIASRPHSLGLSKPVKTYIHFGCIMITAVWRSHLRHIITGVENNWEINAMSNGTIFFQSPDK